MVIKTKTTSQSETFFSGDEEYGTDDENECNNQEDQQSKKLNSGWADSIAKVLKTNKPKGKKVLALSKAKKISDLKRKLTEKEPDPGFEIEGEIKGETDVEIKEEKSPSEILRRKRKKKDIPSLRVKPNILDKDRERALTKIATRGVVQLFNAVRTQQKNIAVKLKEAGPLERKREQVLKNIDKRSFLDVLMGNSRSEEVDNMVKNENNQKVESVESEDHREANNEEKVPTWNVLRDDFMVGARLKDWDKQLTDEEDESNLEDSNDSE